MPGSSNRPRHVLVIGGAGYIGSVLVRRLLGRGIRVRCLDALLYGTGAAVAPLVENPGFSFVRGDMRDPAALATSLDGITDVVLLASLVGDPICRTHPDLARDINVTGSMRVFEALDASEVERFVFLSTCSNYGVRDDAATEESTLNPQSLYADTKVAVEEFLSKRMPDHPCTTTILRVATAFGLSPRMRFDLTVSGFARELALGHELTVYDPETWRPYCHVHDISDGIIDVLNAARSTVGGQVFNVGGDALNYTKTMIVDELRAVIPGAVIRFSGGSPDARNYRVSFAKIHRALGFTPRHTLRGAIGAIARAVSGGLYDDVDRRPEFYGNQLTVRQTSSRV